MVFRRQADLQPLYGEWIRTAMHTVKPDDSAILLGNKPTAHYSEEMGNRYNVRIAGTRLRHAMGKSSIKRYDKFGRMLRIETTTLDVTLFRHYREVEPRDGARVMKYAPMKKTIYSLGALRAANRRYREFLSAIDDPRQGRRKWRRLTRTVRRNAPGYRGCNLFDGCDERLCGVIARGELPIRGMDKQGVAGALAGVDERAGLSFAEAPAHARHHQESQSRLPLLLDRAGASSDRAGAALEEPGNHSSTRHRRGQMKYSAKCDKNFMM